MAQLLSSLPIGTKVKFGTYSVNGETAESIIWVVAAKDHSCSPAYPSDSVTLLTEKIIDLKCFDAAEPDNPDTNRAANGNSRYFLSNIHQWLNAKTAEWYAPQHDYDASPVYSARPGFLSGFSEKEISHILPTSIRIAKGASDDGTYEDITASVFLPSLTEVRLSPATYVNEGSQFAFFSNDASRQATVTSQCYYNHQASAAPVTVGDNWSWWLRSAHATDGGKAHMVTANGTKGSKVVCTDSIGIRPALNVSESLFVSDTTDENQCYTFEWEEYGAAITGKQWLTLPNGTHTVQITAKDDYDTTVRTYTFTKKVDSLSVQTTTPMPSSVMPSRISLKLNGSLPVGASYKVYVCNNGYDNTPTWEDATAAVMSSLAYVFTNTVKKKTTWGVLVKIEVYRGSATEACYINEIGGNFE